MAKRESGTAETVRRIVEPAAYESGLFLWDVTFEKEGADWYLKVLIEKKDGDISIDECEAFSRKIDPLIDEADPVEQSYFLEVGSPGIERRLRLPSHFERYVGAKVCARLIRPDIEGRKEIEGILSAYNGDEIEIKANSAEKIKLSDTAFVRLCDM